MKFFNKPEDNGTKDTVLEELHEKIKLAHIPPHVEKIISKELDMLRMMGSAVAEYTIGLTYINYLITLPWNKNGR